MTPLVFTIHGIPATKKNSPRMFRNRRTGRAFPMPSEASADWTESAIVQLVGQMRAASRLAAVGQFPIIEAVNVRALIYHCPRVELTLTEMDP